MWDEFFSNHKELYESAFHSLAEFKGKVIICLGDIRQILPFVKYATISEQMNAYITTSPLWSSFHLMTLTTNMRLQNMIQNFQCMYSSGSPCAIKDTIGYENYMNDLYKIKRQTNYGQMINMIGEGRYNEDYGAQILEVDNVDKPTLMKYLLTQIPHIEDETQALKELYPNGFNTSEMTSCCIVAATNDRVDHWNKLVQDMNPNNLWHLHLEKLTIHMVS